MQFYIKGPVCFVDVANINACLQHREVECDCEPIGIVTGKSAIGRQVAHHRKDDRGPIERIKSSESAVSKGCKCFPVLATFRDHISADHEEKGDTEIAEVEEEVWLMKEVIKLENSIDLRFSVPCCEVKEHDGQGCDSAQCINL